MPQTQTLTLGVIGGSGVYNIKDLRIIGEHAITTPFGEPSDKIIEADAAGNRVYFLPRHGVGHRLTPSEVNYRANIHALKSLGVTHILAVSAVGIMKEHIHPGDLVIPDQIYDRTKGNRASTFFGRGLVGHVSLADPFCHELATMVAGIAKEHSQRTHVGGTYICIEGPQFSTRAESNYYRQAVDATVIGMTAIPEAKLAREAEIAYAMLALATDYDCWHTTEDDVSAEAVVKVLAANAALANAVIASVAKQSQHLSSCACHDAAQFALVTQTERIPAAIKTELKTLYGKYLK